MNFQDLDTNKNYLAPSLLAANFTNLKNDFSLIDKEKCQILHLDVMDGHFVPNISFGVPIIESIRKHTSILFDTHLMISNPLDYIDIFADAGSDHISFHYEANSPILDTIKKIKSRNMTAGLSIKKETDVEKLFPYLKDIELVLVMSVAPGFGGQEFCKKTFKRVKLLKREIERQGLSLHISVDGGVNSKNAQLLLENGCNVFVAGTSFFKQDFTKEILP